MKEEEEEPYLGITKITWTLNEAAVKVARKEKKLLPRIKEIRRDCFLRNVKN